MVGWGFSMGDSYGMACHREQSHRESTRPYSRFHYPRNKRNEHGIKAWPVRNENPMRDNMKTKHLNNLNNFMRHITALAFVFVHLTVDVIGAEDDREMRDSKLSRVRAMWADGLSADGLKNTQALVDNILTEDDQDRTLSASLLETLLTTKPSSRDVGDEDIALMESVAMHILSATDESREAAGRNSMLLSRFLGRLREEIIPDFSRLPVSANVAPPVGVGVPAFPGMRAEAISDPAARAEYERAIHANLKNNRINRRQHTLARVKRQMVKRVQNYLVRIGREAKISTEHLDICMLEARMETTEKAQLLNRLQREGN